MDPRLKAWVSELGKREGHSKGRKAQVCRPPADRCRAMRASLFWSGAPTPFPGAPLLSGNCESSFANEEINKPHGHQAISLGASCLWQWPGNASCPVWGLWGRGWHTWGGSWQSLRKVSLDPLHFVYDLESAYKLHTHIGILIGIALNLYNIWGECTSLQYWVLGCIHFFRSLRFLNELLWSFPKKFHISFIKFKPRYLCFMYVMF